jgi:hypothetical protein
VRILRKVVGMNLNQAIEASKKFEEEQRLLNEASGYVRELSRDEWVAKMKDYDVVGFRVVLREGK